MLTYGATGVAGASLDENDIEERTRHTHTHSTFEHIEWTNTKIHQIFEWIEIKAHIHCKPNGCFHHRSSESRKNCIDEMQKNHISFVQCWCGKQGNFKRNEKEFRVHFAHDKLNKLYHVDLKVFTLLPLVFTKFRDLFISSKTRKSSFFFG